MHFLVGDNVETVACAVVSGARVRSVGESATYGGQGRNELWAFRPLEAGCEEFDQVLIGGAEVEALGTGGPGDFAFSGDVLGGEVGFPRVDLSRGDGDSEEAGVAAVFCCVRAAVAGNGAAFDRD